MRTTRVFLTVFLLMGSACEGTDPVQSSLTGTGDVGNVSADAVQTDDDVATEDTESPDSVEPSDECTLDQCEIDGGCFDNEAANPDNPCEICLILVDAEAWTADDSATCDDEDLCTVGEHCFEGACSAVVVTCEDGNTCTQDLCDPESGDCSNPPKDGPCDDGDPCTVGDACASGGCHSGSGTLDCEDGNPCTANTCETGVGCVATPLSDIDCNDNNACTVGDRCDAGQCQPGADDLECDDEDVCTVDGCDPNLGCQYNSIAHLCTDDNVCTDQSCDPERGCVFPFNDEPCNDSNACTNFDGCVQGACLGTPVDLTGDVCNVFSCHPITGVSVEYTTLPCSDDNRCTIGDACDTGTCESGQDEPDCDDHNVCTDDDCDPIEECVHVNHERRCDDDNACTDGDRCGGGSCSGNTIPCEDYNDCTFNDCNPETGCLNSLMIENRCRPNITVTYPPRAATLLRTGRTNTVTVTGNVVSGAGSITSFTINGTDVTLDGDGNFSHPVTASVGGNMLIFEAEDTFGSARHVVQSFLWSTVYRQPTEPKEGIIDKGLGIFLGDVVLDDGVRGEPYNDFASIFELILGALDLSEMIPMDPQKFIDEALYDIWITSFSHGAPTVALSPKDGYLLMTMVIPTLRVGMKVKHLWTESGTFTATNITVTAKVRFSVDANNALVATVAEADVDVVINGGSFSFGVSLIGLIAALFKGTLLSTIETEFESAITSEIGAILSDALGSLAFDQVIPFPSLANPDETIDVRLVTDFHSIGVSTDGMAIIERAGAYAADVNSYNNRGAMGRALCGLGDQDMNMHVVDAFELALADDLLNQLLYSAWQGNFLEFEIPSEMLGDVDLPDGVEGLELLASGMLQPTAADCNADHALRLFIGDLRVNANMTLFGSPLNVIIYASFEAGLELSASDDEIGLAITEIVAMETEINVVQEDLISLEPVFASLIADQLVPGLLDLLGGDTLGGFPLPEIDLSAASDIVPPGTIIAISPEEILREVGNTFVQGTLR